MNNFKQTIYEMHAFLLLWLTQSFSGLGSSMTSYALVIWSYSQRGSALMTSMLMICSYAPYVIFSIFAGALSDRWDKKRTMLACDTIAAFTTVITLVLMRGGMLRIWHLYIINAVNGLMNTVQQPASEVAVTRIVPKKHYQRVGGMYSFTTSLNSVLSPLIATAILGLLGIEAVICVDLITFSVAFLTLAFAIRIPDVHQDIKNEESLMASVKQGLDYLKRERGILDLILFLAAINLVASTYDAAFPAMILSRDGGSEQVR